jgi:hypothetical protein
MANALTSNSKILADIANLDADVVTLSGDVNANVKVFRVIKAAANLPQTTQTAIFAVTGDITVVKLKARVTTEIEAQETSIKWVANPTVGADVDLCTQTDINADAVGTIYTITGTLADALVATTSGAVQAQKDGIEVEAGTIDLYADESSTGQIECVLHYIPNTATASVS